MQGFDGIGWLNTYRVFENQPHCFKSISTVVPILQQSVVFDGKQSRIALQKCGLKMDDTWNETFRELPMNQWIQPPPSSRRHLAKPLLEDSIRENYL